MPTPKSKIKNNITKSDGEKMLLNRFEQIIFDNFPGGIIITNKDGDIISANKLYKTSFNHTKNKNIFKNKFYIEKKLVENFKKLLSKGISFRKENCHAVNSQGEDRYLKIIAFPVKNNNSSVVVSICLFIDNTESYNFKSKLIELNSDIGKIVKQRTKELSQVNKELNKSLESKSIFMADVSHEFRTSLTIMQCSLELISKKVDMQKEDLELFKNVTSEIKKISNTLASLISSNLKKDL